MNVEIVYYRNGSEVYVESTPLEYNYPILCFVKDVKERMTDLECDGFALRMGNVKTSVQPVRLWPKSEQKPWESSDYEESYDRTWKHMPESVVRKMGG